MYNSVGSGRLVQTRCMCMLVRHKRWSNNRPVSTYKYVQWDLLITAYWQCSIYMSRSTWTIRNKRYRIRRDATRRDAMERMYDSIHVRAFFYTFIFYKIDSPLYRIFFIFSSRSIVILHNIFYEFLNAETQKYKCIKQ